MNRTMLHDTKRCFVARLAVVVIGLTAIGWANGSVRAQSYAGKIGISIEGVGGKALDFVDLAKTSGPYELMNGGPAPLDADGWPRSDFKVLVCDHRAFGAWAPPIDDPAAFHLDLSGTYKLSFLGQATIADNWSSGITAANKVYDAATNTTTADLIVPASNTGAIPLQFTSTRATPTGALGTGIKHFKLFQPGYPLATTQTFRTEALDALRPFAYVRFMDFVAANNSNSPFPGATTWAGRKQTTDARQVPSSTKKDGAAWEYCIEMGNVLNKDVWINLPIAADDDYVTQLATLLKNTLRPDRTVYVEYSNEVWNGLFAQHDWNRAAAVAEVNAGGSNLNSGNNPHPHEWAQRRYLRRLVQISNLFRNVYGPGSTNNRFRVIFAWQIGGWLPYYDLMLQWTNQHYGAPRGYFYALAGAPYIGHTPVAGQTIGQILADMRRSSDASVSAKTTLKTQANQWGLKFFTYEGGPDNGGGSTINVGNRILANRDPGMRALLVHDLQNNFFNLGGDGFTYFVQTSGYNRYGCWGATEDVKNRNTPKYQALMDLLKPAVPTGLVATRGNRRITLSWTAAPGATVYRVKRSTTSGSGYVPVGTTTGTVFTQTGLSNNTTYYFVVTASNDAGETADSAPASARPTGSFVRDGENATVR